MEGSKHDNRSRKSDTHRRSRGDMSPETDDHDSSKRSRHYESGRSNSDGRKGSTDYGRDSDRYHDDDDSRKRRRNSQSPRRSPVRDYKRSDPRSNPSRSRQACYDYSKGRCSYGSSCKYSHDEPPRRFREDIPRRASRDYEEERYRSERNAEDQIDDQAEPQTTSVNNGSTHEEEHKDELYKIPPSPSPPPLDRDDDVAYGLPPPPPPLHRDEDVAYGLPPPPPPLHGDEDVAYGLPPPPPPLHGDEDVAYGLPPPPPPLHGNLGQGLNGDVGLPPLHGNPGQRIPQSAPPLYENAIVNAGVSHMRESDYSHIPESAVPSDGLFNQEFTFSPEKKAEEDIKLTDDAIANLSKLLGEKSSPQAVESDVNRADEQKMRKKKDKSMLVKNAVTDCVKEALKPTWKEGNMSKETYKTIVKKAVDKVIGTLHHIPKTPEKVAQFVEVSRPKITKLVQGYVDKYVKS